jgi:hypothetical protein
VAAKRIRPRAGRKRERPHISPNFASRLHAHSQKFPPIHSMTSSAVAISEDVAVASLASREDLLWGGLRLEWTFRPFDFRF